MKISGRVHIDLAVLDEGRWGDDRPVQRALQEATWAPPGAEVVFKVKRRQFPPPSGMEWLKSHGQHLGSVTFDCDDPDTIRDWIDRLNNPWRIP